MPVAQITAWKSLRGEELEIRVVQQQSVRSQHAVSLEETQPFQVLHGGRAGAPLHQLLLVRTLGHVDVQHQAAAARLLGRQPKQLVGAGVGGVGAEHGLDPGAASGPALGKAHAFLHLALRVPGLSPVQHGAREPGPDPRLLHGPRHLVHVREVIGEPGDAVLDHLQAAGQRTHVHVLVREQGLDAPHPVEEALSGDVGCVAAEESGGGVGVRVDEPGENRLAAGVQRALRAVLRRQLLGGAHPDQSIPLDRQGEVFPNAVVRVQQETVCDEQVAALHGDLSWAGFDVTVHATRGRLAVARPTARASEGSQWLIERHCRSCRTTSAAPA